VQFAHQCLPFLSGFAESVGVYFILNRPQVISNAQCSNNAVLGRGNDPFVEIATRFPGNECAPAGFTFPQMKNMPGSSFTSSGCQGLLSDHRALIFC
jgi:hypothetical protein